MGTRHGALAGLAIAISLFASAGFCAEAELEEHDDEVVYVLKLWDESPIAFFGALRYAAEKEYAQREKEVQWFIIGPESPDYDLARRVFHEVVGASADKELARLPEDYSMPRVSALERLMGRLGYGPKATAVSKFWPR